MGHGPRLPASGVALALAGDAVRVTLRNVGAAVRGHPLGSLLLAAGVTGAVLCYVLLVTVSIRFMAPPAHGAHPTHPLNAAGPDGLAPPPGPGVAGRLGAPSAAGTGPGGGPPPVSGGIPSPRVPGHTPRPVPSATPDPSASPVPTSPGPSPLPTPTPTPRPSRTGPPTPSPSPSPSGLCVLGLCL